MSVIGNQGYSSSGNGVGGSIPGILPTSAAIGNRTSVSGLGVSPVLGNAGPRITSSMGSIVGGGNIGRNISSGGGLSVPGLASRFTLTGNSGSGNLNVQGQNRLMSGMLQQGNISCNSSSLLLTISYGICNVSIGTITCLSMLLIFSSAGYANIHKVMHVFSPVLYCSI